MKKFKKTVPLDFLGEKGEEEYNKLIVNAIKSKIGSYDKDLIFTPNITAYIKSKVL